MLKSNETEQMIKRLQADLKLIAAELSVEKPQENALVVKSGADVKAVIVMKRREFNGYNILNELSSEVGQGFPEHEAFVVFAADCTLVQIAKLVKATAAIGCSSMKVCQTAGAPSVADASDANLQAELGNDARLGAVGR